MHDVSAIQSREAIHGNRRRVAPWVFVLAVGTACTEPIGHTPERITAPSQLRPEVAPTWIDVAWSHIAFDLQIDASEPSRAPHPPILIHVEDDNPRGGPRKTIYTFLPTTSGMPGIEAGPRGVNRIEVDGATGRSRAFRKDGTTFVVGDMSEMPALGFDPQRNVPDSLRRQRDAMRSRPPARGAAGAGASWIDGLVVRRGSGRAFAERVSHIAGAATHDALGRDRYVAVRGAHALEFIVDQALDDVVESSISENGRVLGRVRYEHQVLPSGVLLRSRIIRDQTLANGTRHLSMSLSNVTLGQGGQ